MLSVQNKTSEIIIKKSKFITYIYKVDTKEDIENYLLNIKQEYKDATHICYAYILENTKKCSDDGEPSKTAGMPILNILENNNLDHTLCIVIRYFGGIKLGANGLIRAYSNSAKEILKDNIIELEEGKQIKISFNYDKTKTIENLLKNTTIINKQYDDNIIYEIEINNKEYHIIKEELIKNTINQTIIKDCFIEKIKD